MSYLSTPKKGDKVFYMKDKIEVLENATYSNSEAQSILGLKKNAMGERIAKGDLKPSIMGNKYRFFGKDLIDYLRSQQA